MALKLTDKMKMETLHKLLEEYGRQILWVKDLDFKIIYYTLGLLVGIVAWFIANPPQKTIIIYLYGLIIFVSFWSIVFIFRNHVRHAELLDKLKNVHFALMLNTTGQYTNFPLEKNRSYKDVAFHIGRLLYILAIVIACVFSTIIINSLVTLPNSLNNVK